MGTFINCIAIVFGGLIGMLFGKGMKDNMKETLMTINGVSVMFVAIMGVVSNLLVYENGAFSTKSTLAMILSLAIGSVIGEWLQLTEKMETFGEWLKQKTGNQKDTKFTDGFVTASLTVCIGAMAVVGAIEDGVSGNYDILVTKAILDFVIILVMSASLGKGCLFSFIPVGIFQGVITLLASFLKNWISDPALQAISLTGSVLIFCVGLNLVFDKKIRVANLLPALLIAMVFAYLGVG